MIREIFLLSVFVPSLLWAQTPPTGMVLVKGNEYHLKHQSYGELDTVIILRDYFLDKYEVTVAQFAAFVEATGYVTQAEMDGYSIVEGGEHIKGVTWRCDEKGRLRNQRTMPSILLYMSPGTMHKLMLNGQESGFRKKPNGKMPSENLQTRSTFTAVETTGGRLHGRGKMEGPTPLEK